MRSCTVYFKYLYYFTRYGSLKKIYNYILNRIEKKLKITYLKSYPVNITVEPCNICNLSCPGCVTGVKHAQAYKPLMLNLDQFKYIFDQFKDYVFNISLYNWGEPFLNKDIFLMIDHASLNKCGITVHSNFNIFDESMAEKSIKSHLTHIYLSIDGATQPVYEKYRRGGDLSRVFRNIEILVSMKKKLKSIFPLLTWKYLIFPHNVGEIDSAKRMSRELGVDAFEVFPANLDNLSTFGIARYYDLTTGDITISTADFCDSLWDSLIVYPDGSIFPCCQSFRNKDIFGNIFDKPFREVWNNNNFLTARKILCAKKVEAEVRYPCRDCEIIKKLQAS